MRKARAIRFVMLCLFIASAGALGAYAGDDSVVPNQTDRDAVSHAQSRHHALPARTAGGEAMKVLQKLNQKSSGSGGSGGVGEGVGPIVRYPGDMQFHGGPTVDNMVSHAIYMQLNGVCPVASCWGNPETFLSDLGKSDFIHVLDQYVGLHGDNRYTSGGHAFVSFTPQSTPFTDADMLTVVHAVATKTGLTGYGHEYHVFLPQGTDECFDSTDSQCYSPDNPSTFFFCAYHGSVDFPDIGHVLYSVEPYQNVNGCSVKPGTPNGVLVDSTNSTLSHELHETISDPDLDAWWNLLSNADNGDEIGDECEFLKFDSSGNYLGFDPSVIVANGHKYAIQPEYSNLGHACLALP